MKSLHLRAATSAAILLAGCHHAANLENDPTAVAAVHPELRLVNGESTWVSRGVGYEVIGRSRGDLVLTHAALERASATMRGVFPTDSLTTLVVRVRRIPAEGQPFLSPPPVLADERRPTVEMIIPDPRAKHDDGDERGRMRMLGMSDPTQPVIRAWLSAHATQRTHVLTHASQAAGESHDARVPAWATAVVTSLGQDSLSDRGALALSSHADAIIPLDRFFSMDEPFPDTPAAREPASREGRGMPTGGGMAGGMGVGGRGGGGRGGMGGGRGGMGGRGGSPGGGERERAALMPLGEDAAYTAEAETLSRYLAREGYDFIGTLIDAQIAGQPVAEAFAKRQFVIAQVDRDYRRWIVERAAAVKH